VSENLAEMVREFNEKTIRKEIDDDIGEQEEIIPKEKVQETTRSVSVIMFVDWVEKYHKEMMVTSGIRRAKIQAAGIDQNNEALFTSPHPEGEAEKRTMTVIYGTDQYPVFDLPPIGVKIFRNATFLITYHIDSNLYVKCYHLKTGLFIVNCLMNNDQLIPYHIEKFKKKEKNILLTYPDTQNLINKLPQPSDSEGIYLLYKQAQKVHESFITNQDVLNWFLDREKEVMDINHLMQIDEVLAFVFK